MQVTAGQPDQVSPLGLEAMEHARRGKTTLAIASAERGLELRPDDLGLRLFLGMLHCRRMQLDQAIPHFQAALAIEPSNWIATGELIRVLIGLGQLDEAAKLLASSSLSSAETLRLRASLLQRRGDYEAAVSLYREVVGLAAGDFESWGNLGICLAAAGQSGDAVEAFARSLAIRPGRLAYWYKWAEAHLAAGTAEEGLAEARSRDSHSATDSTMKLVMAHFETLLGNAARALAHLEEAVASDPGNGDAALALAEALERQNSLERASALAGQLAASPDPPERLPLLEARLLFRQGAYGAAIARLQSVSPLVDPGGHAQLMGSCFDRVGDADAAFAAFAQMNAADAGAGRMIGSLPRQYRDGIAEQRRTLSEDWVGSWSADVPPASREPAFLVGFPRSGTTLLDTFLMGHPKVAVAEEEPMLQSVGAALGSFENVANLDADDVEGLRGLYFRIADRHVAGAPGRLLLDKYPFGIGSAAIIHRLFPNAKIILAERHPCDVVLSCFMTRFQPTQAATNFLSLQDTALLYDEIMRLWFKTLRLLPLAVHPVRYERLITQTEKELRAASAFLSLDWCPAMLDHCATAGRRSFIKTPSYSQVIEPLDARRVARWRAYEKQLAPVMPILAPWVERFGYKL